MSYFGIPSARIQKLRSGIMSIQPEVCVERAVLVTDVYTKNMDKPVVIKRALALENVLRNMSVFIEDGALIVGNQASSNRAAPIFPEYAFDWILEEMDGWEKRDGDRFVIKNENKKKLKEIAKYWKGNTLKDKGLALMPGLARKYYDAGIIKVEGNITAGDAHLAVNYEKLLQKGLAGFREETEIQIAKVDMSDYSQMKKAYFYEAILIAVDACIFFANRFACLAEELAEKEKNSERKEELNEIARICRRVPEHPARNFHEALQAVWFIQLILQIESSGHSLSFGRFDQYVYPYYENDIKNGTLSQDRALELLENLWLKTFTINKIRSNSHTKFSAGSPLYQNVCIGGQNEDEKDAVNDVSFLMIKSVAQMKLTQPNLSVRYHKNMEDRFLYDCVQLLKLGFGMPSFNNDEIIIDSFIKRGVNKKDAVNYCSIGCIEVSIPGKFGYRTSGMNFMNFPKILMLALNDGVDILTGEKLYEGAGFFPDMKSFDEVWDAWVKAVKHFTRYSVILDNCADLALEQEVPDIVCSALVDDCIDRGLTLKEGGAVYDFIGPLQVGIANIGNSLAAIKKLVFEEKKLTANDLWDAILGNFEGAAGSRIQSMLLYDVPKFGNDDDFVDDLTVKAYEVYMDEIDNYHNTRYGRGPIGGGYYASTSSISANVPQGKIVSATPDGRKAGEPIAEGCSPTHSTDVNGPTAVFNSLSKMPTIRMLGGVLLNQKISPKLLEEEQDIKKFMDMIRTFFDDLKGFHVQYNVVEKETLIDAQIHPEKHRDLIVRVAGYSAFFNVLSRDTQDDIIQRTEHKAI